jgi:hypothetical protein
MLEGTTGPRRGPRHRDIEGLLDDQFDRLRALDDLGDGFGHGNLDWLPARDIETQPDSNATCYLG